MSKVSLFITVYSVVLICLFFIFCYLISIVNPPPLKPDIDALSENELKFQNILFDDVLLPPFDKFGLEKAESSNIQTPPPFGSRFSAFAQNNSQVLRFTQRRVRPPILAPVAAYASKDIYDSAISTIANDVKFERLNNIAVTANTTKHTEDTFEPYSFKESSIVGHKRSVRHFNEIVDRNTGSVILKIIDDSGLTKVEIRLDSKDSLKRKISKDDGLLKKKSKFSMGIQTNNSNRFKGTRLAMNSILTIMPNNTVIIDEFDDKIPLNKEKTVNSLSIRDNKIVKTVLDKNNNTKKTFEGFGKTNISVTNLSSNNTTTLVPNLYTAVKEISQDIENSTHISSSFVDDSNFNSTKKITSIYENFISILQNKTAGTPKYDEIYASKAVLDNEAKYFTNNTLDNNSYSTDISTTTKGLNNFTDDLMRLDVNDVLINNTMTNYNISSSDSYNV